MRCKYSRHGINSPKSSVLMLRSNRSLEQDPSKQNGESTVCVDYLGIQNNWSRVQKLVIGERGRRGRNSYWIHSIFHSTSAISPTPTAHLLSLGTTIMPTTHINSSHKPLKPNRSHLYLFIDIIPIKKCLLVTCIDLCLFWFLDGVLLCHSG